MMSWVTVMVMAMGDGDVEVMVMRACGRGCGRGDGDGDVEGLVVVVVCGDVRVASTHARRWPSRERRLARPRHRNAKIESERARARERGARERSPGIIYCYCRCRRVRRRTAPHNLAVARRRTQSGSRAAAVELLASDRKSVHARARNQVRAPPRASLSPSRRRADLRFLLVRAVAVCGRVPSRARHVAGLSRACHVVAPSAALLRSRRGAIPMRSRCAARCRCVALWCNPDAIPMCGAMPMRCTVVHPRCDPDVRRDPRAVRWCDPAATSS